MKTLQQAFAAITDSCQPQTLLSCGQCASAIAARWAEHHPSSSHTELAPARALSAFPLPQTHDLALLSDILEQLSVVDGSLLLGQLRNYGTHQIAVAVTEQAAWTFQDFIGLGFTRQGRIGDGDHVAQLYTYNIDSYNHRRSWNNPDHWANPDRWGKAWW
ncbi:DUF6231 family protein [Marinobacter sp. SS21]|uniref:DUF6231 family protein n=1 Tax=Marinobacter sp. SS21 TaxID=2979460 RepID=UPI00232FD362|nr:DUF6231 family protein [Marinobacter sp. SS21]MDC0661248.1 DUF6231 family protein [Marinobacter sp. SS21]